MLIDCPYLKTRRINLRDSACVVVANQNIIREPYVNPHVIWGYIVLFSQAPFAASFSAIMSPATCL